MRNVLVLASFFTAGAAILPAQTAYTITETSVIGTMKVYRNGNKAKVELANTTALIDLENHKVTTWDPTKTPIACQTATDPGSWGDPFETSKDMKAEMDKSNPTQTGKETVAGIETQVMEATSPDGKMKAWIDPASGLLLKAQLTPTGGEPKIILEITSVSLEAPAAAVFEKPAACAAN
jgi:outer membrane lipoprotein-sorting protein